MPLILADGLRDVESEVPGDAGRGVVVFDVCASLDLSWQREAEKQASVRKQPRLRQFLGSIFLSWGKGLVSY